MEIRVKVSSRQTEAILSFSIDFLSGIFFFKVGGRVGGWVLPLHCQQKVKATLTLLFHAACGQSVFVLRYHHENFFWPTMTGTVPHISHQRHLLKKDLCPEGTPPHLPPFLHTHTHTICIKLCSSTEMCADFRSVEKCISSISNHQEWMK